MPARKLPDNDQLIKWLGEGKTHQQIADLAEQVTGNKVTAIAVRVAVSRLGVADRRPRYSQWLPWKVQARHNKLYAATMLRAYARYEEAGRDPAVLPDDLRVRMFNWLALLSERGEVVDYDPAQGFIYVPARAGESIIRQPKPGKPTRKTA